jgi:hypothetical protein
MSNDKLVELKRMMEMNDVFDKPSCCFHCTLSFYTDKYHIPKHIMNNKYYVYGVFCSPECAASYLFKENICVNVKFERFHLLHALYNLIKITPAPNPHFLLNKFCGNLTEEEYRKLFFNEKTICFSEKPIVCISCEMGEVNLNTLVVGTKTSEQQLPKVKNIFTQLLNK